MLLTNGSTYKICKVKHTIRPHLKFTKPIPMTDSYKLECLYKVIKYTTEFLESHNIDYCIESGTLLGYRRHFGIIPWDNDVDIMIFRDGYFKLLRLLKEYNNNHFTILECTPGFKLFYNNSNYGELFVYDYDENTNKYKFGFPYINNKPTFITSDIYFTYSKYDKDELFPTKKVKFEDFTVRVPNKINNVLKNIFGNNFYECKYCSTKNNFYESFKLDKYKVFSKFEKIIIKHKLFLLYIIIHKLCEYNITINSK
jgi:phosphorylcholine metabolism protein LicD